MNGRSNFYDFERQMNDQEGSKMKLSTRELELRRKKLLGYILGIAMVALTVLVIVMLAY